uniref:Capsid protein n=1 Tax=Cressdnaviricota sp. TaxID=2748378 RepID=A0A890UZD9_9VIRU|nr:MAG: capsid protein [Cressdnaviricota sp.]
MVATRKQRKSGKRSTRKAPKALSRPAKKQVAKIAARVVNSKAETKMVAWFNGPVAQPGPSPPLQNSTGLYGDADRVAHNQFITSNTNDILKVIPDVAPNGGVASDNKREGRFINPVSGLLRCRVQISPEAPQSGGWAGNVAYDLTVVAYLLQSVSYKTYRSLYANNDFKKMLDVMDGTTINFDGNFSDGTLPVEKGYYKVLGKKMIYLRSSGGLGAANVITSPGNQNSHKLQHEWTWNYGKHLPKKLLYPEDNVSVDNGLHEPLNSSIFWCVGYYNTDGSVPSATPLPINIGIDYTSIMKFKDF